MPGYIHHIEWFVTDLERISNQLIDCYGFSKFAQRKCVSSGARQIVVKSGKTVFVLTTRCEDEDVDAAANSRGDNKQCGGVVKDLATGYPILFGSLEVGNVEEVIERCRDSESLIIQEPCTIVDDDGEVRYSRVKSIVGNVEHSIVNTKKYKGLFLPGFQPCPQSNKIELSNITSYMDHVTYVCNPGESQAILDWYACCFGMRRFLVNSQEALEEGVVIGEEVGMRMKVGEWISSWLCREEGVRLPQEGNENGDSSSQDDFKLVLAEPLEDRPDSHVQKFLDDHGGPGLQHIGLVSRGPIAGTVEEMLLRGAQFRTPPPTYYKLDCKRSEIEQSGYDLSTFERLGLLLDSEADIEVSSNGHSVERNLIQIFTKPLFEKNTFFLEILERNGARGFGAGNITALARSIQMHQMEIETRKNTANEITVPL